MKKITAKFNSQCAETGTRIKKGDSMFYDYSNKKCYSVNSQKAKSIETDNDSNFIQAQEDAFFDNFCHNNNI